MFGQMLREHQRRADAYALLCGCLQRLAPREVRGIFFFCVSMQCGVTIDIGFAQLWSRMCGGLMLVYFQNRNAIRRRYSEALVQYWEKLKEKERKAAERQVQLSPAICHSLLSSVVHSFVPSSHTPCRKSALVFGPSSLPPPAASCAPPPTLKPYYPFSLKSATSKHAASCSASECLLACSDVPIAGDSSRMFDSYHMLYRGCIVAPT